MRGEIMEVKVKYLSGDVAEHFGSNMKMETVRVSNKATYEQLLGLFRKKYETAGNQLYGGKLKGKMLDTFVFICKGKSLQTIQHELINPEVEVLVGYLDYGG